MNRRPIQVLMAAVVAAVTIAGVGWTPGGASGATVSSGSPTSAPSTTSRASLTSLRCHHALLPANRSISDTAVIRAVSGTTKLAVNFRLGRRPVRGGAFVPVHGLGLGTWLTKDFGQQPGDVWRVVHTVRDLSAPAVYRFQVSFRWIGSSGQIIDRATRSSRTCFQPELRPNLQVRSIAIHPDAADTSKDVYRALIRNAGATGVRHFQVSLTQGETVVDLRGAGPIAPHQKLAVRLVGPICSSTAPPVVTVDPNHRVNVSSRAQASLAATCPAS